MKLVLFGIQGAGKSTQGNLLSKQFKIPYLSTGHIFREMAKEKTPLGRFLKETLNAGLLVPDDKTVPIVEEYLSRPIYQRGYILDGFPRTLKQVKQFKNGIDRVIYLEVPEKEALWRIADRNDTSRNDETLKAVKKRIELYYDSTMPVIEHYKKESKLITVDGTKSIKEVNREILKNLGKEVVKNQVRPWEPKKKTIIALVALPGAGKSEAARYFAAKKIPVIHFNQVIEYIDEHKMEHSDATHKQVREALRAQYGLEAMAYLNVDKIQDALEKSPIIVIENMRSWEEYLFLKKKFEKVNLVIVSMYSQKHVRAHRIAKRGYLSKNFTEQRDIDELMGVNMGPTIAFADYLIVNDSTLQDFYHKLEHIYQTIYFS